MNSNLSPVWAFPPKGLRFLLIVILALGVFFRFVNIDRKVYWFDETFTSLRISGYTEKEAIAQLCNGQQIGVEDLQKYQPLLITSCQSTWPLGDEMALSHRLDPKVRLLLVKESNVPQIPNTFSDVFFYNPYYNEPLKVLEYKLEKEQKYKIQKDVYPQNIQLWKLTN